jgi:hypothetical protein
VTPEFDAGAEELGTFIAEVRLQFDQPDLAVAESHADELVRALEHRYTWLRVHLDNVRPITGEEG